MFEHMFDEGSRPLGRGTRLHLQLDAIARGAPLPGKSLRILVRLGYADGTITPPVLTAEGRHLLAALGPLPG